MEKTNKIQYIMVRVSPEEKAVIQQGRKKRNITSDSGYGRKLMLDDAKKALKNI